MAGWGYFGPGFNAQDDVSMGLDSGEAPAQASMLSDRSGCSENDIFFFPTPSERARGKAQREARVGGLRGDDTITRGATYPPETARASEKVSKRAAEQLLSQKDAQLAEKDQVIADLQQQFAALTHQMQSQQQDLTLEMASYQDQITYQQSELQSAKQAIMGLTTPKAKQQYIANPRFTKGYSDLQLSAPTMKYPVAPQQQPQNLQDLFYTPQNFTRRPQPLVSPPEVFNGSSYLTNPFQATPNPADDVFGAPVPMPTYGVVYLPAADFEKKSLPELLTSCFKKAEMALRGVELVDIISQPGRLPREQYSIVKLAQEHLHHQKMAYVLLQSVNERSWLMTGLLSHEIVRQVFNAPVLGDFPSTKSFHYTQQWDHEQAHRNIQHPDAGNLPKRFRLAQIRAQYAKDIVAMPGFWKWVQEHVAVKTKEILAVYAVTIPARFHHAVETKIQKAVDEAVRIAIRMRQEPEIYEFFFPSNGCGWNSTYHVHRNAELVGQELSDERTPYVVRCTGLPLVKSKYFGDGSADPTVLHKAEVMVGDRKANLRPTRLRH
ncbi:hypothetical protein LTR37_000437 [Vermiconidia calcicola]|uniref:Uncharacterized protein n=1 Tax=Vermiconidia calcicola TaxID=1690605 RepID=A0ACC3NYA1_9PEZI|nr:hypothetical protein LTR37_000437 [Vermiconidia calcicola]